MSALTDYFTSLANKIRAKVGGSQTYTPTQMVSAIDDVYDAGAASVPTPTSITPSDANPVALTANTAVKPTTNGYAVENVNSITPSTNVPSMTANKIYKPSANGYAIAAYSNLYPSDSNPQAISGPYIYRLPSGNSGYVYETLQSGAGMFADAPDVNWYNMSAGSSGTASITVTQKPRYIIAAMTSRGSTYNFRTIFVDVANNKGWQMGARGSGTAVNEDFSSSISEVFPTISATTVVYSYTWWAANQRVEIGIYY